MVPSILDSNYNHVLQYAFRNGYQFSKVLDIGIVSSKLARTRTFETFCQGFEMGKGKSAPGASAKGKERADHSILNHCTRGCVVCASRRESMRRRIHAWCVPLCGVCSGARDYEDTCMSFTNYIYDFGAAELRVP